MNVSEFGKVLAGIIVLTISWSFVKIMIGDFKIIPQMFLFSTIIILVSVFSKKIMANMLDADVEHDIWKVQRYWLFQNSKFREPIPAGIILPLFFSLFSLGLIKLSSILTYETRAKTSRKAKRLGHYSFSEMTDWDNGLIGAAGVVAVLGLGGIAYFFPYPNFSLELLTKMSVFYAFWNMIPASNLDGTQIFFGSRTLWAILATITLIFTALSLMIYI